MLNTENTGESATGGLDNNWNYEAFYNIYSFSSTTDGTPGGKATVITSPRPSAWLANSSAPSASWIGPAANQNDNSANGTVGGNTPGVYVYTLTFSSTTARTVQVSGQIAADNDYEIANGATLSTATIDVAAPGGSAIGTSPSSSNNYGFSTTTTAEQYASTTAFSFDLNVGAGSTTTLDFLVLNQNNGYNNPTGLFVDNLQVVAVPELPTWVFIVAGLGLVAFGRHRAQLALPPIPVVGEVPQPGLNA
jgi:hypothetical protein